MKSNQHLLKFINWIMKLQHFEVRQCYHFFLKDYAVILRFHLNTLFGLMNSTHVIETSIILFWFILIVFIKIDFEIFIHLIYFQHLLIIFRIFFLILFRWFIIQVFIFHLVIPLLFLFCAQIFLVGHCIIIPYFIISFIFFRILIQPELLAFRDL